MNKRQINVLAYKLAGLFLESDLSAGADMLSHVNGSESDANKLANKMREIAGALYRRGENIEQQLAARGMPVLCLLCGGPMQDVRPGKVQCSRCEGQ